jgi:uncharacterized protein (TIGR03437 family)
MTLRKTLAIAIAVAVKCCFTVSNRLVAATAPMVTYTASGTFASPATSGADTLKLAGEPFSVSISASAASEPFEHGSNWGAYDKLKLTGSVHSGLLGTTPVTIATIKAVIVLPLGTIANPYLHPFSAIALAPGNSTVTYSDSSASTVLAIQTGGLTATIPSGDPRASAVVLHSGGAEAVTTHADGTASVRSIGAAPVDLGASTDAVALKFYAYGVSGASEVHVQMGGEEVPLLYAAASGYFPGLDEVMVKVPRSFAGRGATEVTLTVDGQTAAPVHIQIQ